MSRYAYFTLVTILIVALPCAGQVNLKRPQLKDEAFEELWRQNHSPVVSPEPEVTSLEMEILKKAYALLETNTQYAYTFLQDTLDTGAPVSAAFNLALANVYFQNGNYFQAETQFRAAVQKHPTFRRAWNGIGLVRYHEGDYEEAAKALTRCVMYGANDAMTFGILGYCHLRLGRYRSAETAYNYAVLFDPDQTDWAEGLAQVYAETGRHPESIAVLDGLIRSRPDNTEFWLLKANSWLALDEPLKSARCIEIARRVGEVDVKSLYLLGNIYLDQGIFDQAREVFIAAASIDEELDALEALRAVRYLVSKDQTEFARDLFSQIPEESDSWSSRDKTLYRFLKGEFAFAEGSYEESEAAYLRGLEFDPFNGYTLLKLADLKMRQGDLEQAIVYFDRATLDDESKYMALVSKSMALIDNKQFRYALKTIEQALEENREERLTRLYAQVRRVVETETH